MRASIDSICANMDSDPRKADTQISCLNSLFSVLRDEKSIEKYQQAFKSIDNAVKANQNNDSVIVQVLNLFGQLSAIRTLAGKLEATNIFTQLIHILNLKKEDNEISEICLQVISQTISLPRMASHFSSQQFIKTLVFVTRLNSKSQIHALYISKIAMYLNARMELVLKDLCISLVVLSRNFIRNEQLQESILSGFAQLSGTKIMAEVASLSIPHFTDIALRYNRNITILKSLLTILSQSPSNAIQDIDFSIIMDQSKRFKNDPQMIMKSVDFISSKMDPKQTPVEVIPLVIMALQFFLSNQAVLKQSLTLCYYSTTSSSDDAPVSPKLIQLLTSILLLHSRDPSLIRRSAAIIHSLSSNQENDEFLIEASAPSALIQSIQLNMKDQHSIECMIASLCNFVSNNKELATQICTYDNLKILMQVCKTYKNEPKIIKNAVLLIKSLALSKYEFPEFIDLPEEEKKEFYIDKKLGVAILKKQLSNLNLVKSVLLLMPPSPDESSLIGSAMIKYSKDSEIQYAGLLHNISDLSAINRALLLCGENAFRYAIQSLKESEEILPPQTIDFLLSLNRWDAIDILMIHIDRASAPAISSQFKLNYIEQVVIADALHNLNLWNPSESDSKLIITSLYHSIYDQRQLCAALSFAEDIGLTETSFPFLIDAIKRHPTNRNIVAICAEFVSELSLNSEIESYCITNNVVPVVGYALEFNKDDEPVAFSLLKMIHYFSSFGDLIKFFSQSILISLLSKTAKLSDRCSIQCCRIFSNIVKDKDCACMMNNNKVSKIIFDHFNIDNYQLVFFLMENANLVLSHEQFEIAKNHLAQFNSNISADETFYLLQIVLRCFEKEETQICDLEFKDLIPIITTFSANPKIIQLSARLVAYSDGYKQSTELLYALLDALKFNINAYDAVLAIFMILPEFYSIKKHHQTFSAQPTMELFTELLHHYPSDVTICSFSLKLFKGKPAALDLCSAIMNEQTDEETLVAISQYIYSISEEYDISSLLQPIFIVLDQGINNVELYDNLLPSIFYLSNNESTYSAIMPKFNKIANIFMMYSSSMGVSLGFLGIVHNLSSNPSNASALTKYIPLIGIAMKLWIKDPQFQNVGSQAISHFVSAGKGALFYNTLPVLDMALKLAVDLESTCNAITTLADYVGEFAPMFVNDMLQLISQDVDNEYVPLLAQCILSIISYNKSEDVVFDRLMEIFDLISTSTIDINSASLLEICAVLKNPEKMLLFEPVIRNLVDYTKQQKIKIAIGAAKCILTLSSICPELVDPFGDEIIEISQRVSGELLRIFLQVKNVLFGIRKKIKA